MSHSAFCVISCFPGNKQANHIWPNHALLPITEAAALLTKEFKSKMYSVLVQTWNWGETMLNPFLILYSLDN